MGLPSASEDLSGVSEFQTGRKNENFGLSNKLHEKFSSWVRWALERKGQMCQELPESSLPLLVSRSHALPSPGMAGSGPLALSYSCQVRQGAILHSALLERKWIVWNRGRASQKQQKKENVNWSTILYLQSHGGLSCLPGVQGLPFIIIYVPLQSFKLSLLLTTISSSLCLCS